MLKNPQPLPERKWAPASVTKGWDRTTTVHEGWLLHRYWIVKESAIREKVAERLKARVTQVKDRIDKFEDYLKRKTQQEPLQEFCWERDETNFTPKGKIILLGEERVWKIDARFYKMFVDAGDCNFYLYEETEESDSANTTKNPLKVLRGEEVIGVLAPLQFDKDLAEQIEEVKREYITSLRND